MSHMDPIYLNHNYRRVKFVLLALMITMGTEAKELMEGATDYFELLKGGLCALVFFGAIFIYVYIEHKDGQNEDEADEQDDEDGNGDLNEITTDETPGPS